MIRHEFVPSCWELGETIKSKAISVLLSDLKNIIIIWYELSLQYKIYTSWKLIQNK